ncbi:MAG: hypothetical protein ACFFD1_00745, partial [Candidatus Thorarchaeota archaeon]
LSKYFSNYFYVFTLFISVLNKRRNPTPKKIIKLPCFVAGVPALIIAPVHNKLHIPKSQATYQY